jgi:hypothetical protein
VQLLRCAKLIHNAFAAGQKLPQTSPISLGVGSRRGGCALRDLSNRSIGRLKKRK